MTSAGEGGKLSFARDIRPLFREKDRESMLAAFDLEVSVPTAAPALTNAIFALTGTRIRRLPIAKTIGIY